MKKILFGLMIVSAATVQAQDAKAVKKALDAKDFAKAQTAVEAFITKSPEKAEAWYWKHKVYWTISSDETLAAATPNALATGYEAVKKYLSLEKDMKVMAMDNITSPTAPVEAYYTKYRSIGSAALDAGAADATKFPVAFENLSKALDVSKLYYDLGWIKTAVDTSIVFYTGYAAMQAKNDEGALKYFTILSDADAKESADFRIGYGWLANYYLNEKKDKVKGAAALEKGLNFFPNDEYLKSLKNEQINNSGDYTTMLANDAAKIAVADAPFSDYLQYVSHLFDYVYVDKKDATDRAEKLKTLDEIIAKALQLKPNNSELNYISGLHHVQKYVDLDDKIKALRGKTTPADKAAREKLQVERLTEIDISIKHFELVSSILRAKGDKRTAAEKDRLKDVLTKLIFFYDFKKDESRKKDTEEDLKDLGA